ncbi:MAG: hypothetical protein VX697_07540, partial [Pseudomonadota bacterium]|nr:hypothetical protein [Pseudomonadota bacterium]
MTSSAPQKSQIPTARFTALIKSVAIVAFGWFHFGTCIRTGLSLCLASTLFASASEDMTVAVATNFLQTAQSLRSEFQQ